MIVQYYKLGCFCDQDSLWKRYLSHCPWLATARQTFFNDLVISKRSSRHNVQAGRAGIQMSLGSHYVELRV